MKFSSLEGPFLFLTATHANDDSLGGVGFYFANANYCILLAGYNPIHKTSELDAGIKAVKERNFHI